MVKRMKKVFPIVVNRNLFLHLRINIKDNSLVMINGKIHILNISTRRASLMKSIHTTSNVLIFSK